MSVFLHITTCQASAAGAPPNPDRDPLTRIKVSIQRVFRDCLFRLIDGTMKENLPCSEYCGLKWDLANETHRRPIPPNVTREAFMQSCISDCIGAQRFAEWHRKN